MLTATDDAHNSSTSFLHHEGLMTRPSTAAHNRSSRPVTAGSRPATARSRPATAGRQTPTDKYTTAGHAGAMQTVQEENMDANFLPLQAVYGKSGRFDIATMPTRFVEKIIMYFDRIQRMWIAIRRRHPDIKHNRVGGSPHVHVC